MSGQQIRGNFVLGWAILMLLVFFPIGIMLLWLAARKYHQEGNPAMMRITGIILSIILVIIFILLPLGIIVWASISWS